MDIFKKKLPLTMVLVLCIGNANIFAQDATPTATPLPASNPDQIVTFEGVSEDIDDKRRSPSVSYSTSIGDTSSTILVDAYIPNKDFEKYPIKFDFFIAGKLFESQVRSSELPRPIGIEVPFKTAGIPYNFSIVATLLHPNRQFSSVVHATVEKSVATPTPSATPQTSLTPLPNPTSVQFSCDLEGPASESDAETDDILLATSVTFTQEAGSTSYNAVASNDDIPSTVNFNNFLFENDTGSGELAYNNQSFSVSGSITRSDSGQIEELDFVNDDETVVLSCFAGSALEMNSLFRN
jgi:hypothetical protein